MIAYSVREDAVTIQVQVVPRASRSEVVGEYNGSLRIRLAAPPVDGAANEELIRVLARAFKVPRGAVKLVSGHSSKIKQVSIEALPDKIVAQLKRDSWS